MEQINIIDRYFTIALFILLVSMIIVGVISPITLVENIIIETVMVFIASLPSNIRYLQRNMFMKKIIEGDDTKSLYLSLLLLGGMIYSVWIWIVIWGT